MRILEASAHPTELVEMPDGRVLRQVVIAMDADGVEQLRLGYACGNCFEEFEEAFPEQCPVCHFRVRELQPRLFEREFGGAVLLGPRTSLEEEMAGIRERVEREGI